jgi:hypothetical protein
MIALVLVGALGATPVPLPIPGGEGGLGFDDLVFSEPLHRVLVPAGRLGAVFLVDPATRQLQRVGGLSQSGSWASGHGQGATSADARPGTLFVADRESKRLLAIPLGAKTPSAAVSLEGGPDYVRWVEPTSEVWVTEPGQKAIELFRFSAGERPTLIRAGRIDVPDGPESLVIDVQHGRALTNTWHDETVAIDLKSRAITARWKNGCKGARGLTTDPARSLVFVGCEEGAAVVLDVARGGKVVGRAKTGAGVDLIAYALGHVYVPAADSGRLDVLAVGPDGSLTPLWNAPTAAEAHCVATDDSGHVYVCDPKGGRLLVFTDENGRTR